MNALATQPAPKLSFAIQAIDKLIGFTVDGGDGINVTFVISVGSSKRGNRSSLAGEPPPARFFRIWLKANRFPPCQKSTE